MEEFVLAYVDFFLVMTWAEAVDEAHRLDELAAAGFVRSCVDGGIDPVRPAMHPRK